MTDEPKKYFSVNGIFFLLVMQDGNIIGKRKRKIKMKTIDFEFEFMKKQPKKALLEEQIERYCEFRLRKPGKIHIST